MHGESQAIVSRLMASSGFTKNRGESDAKLAARLILESSGSCKCGCGGKTMPNVSITNAAISFLIGNGGNVNFRDYLNKHQYYKHPANADFDEFQHQAIIASILGDGCLIRPTVRSNHRLVWNMGSSDHAKFKNEFFSFLGSSFSEKKNPGFGENWYCIKTGCHPKLTEYSNKYGDSKGLIDESGIAFELNDFGWAWYYGDDGHLDKKNEICFMHTEGKTHEMVINIRDALRKFISSDGVNIHKYVGGSKKRQLECIRMGKNESKDFMSRVEKHMANGMEYKII
ncbi:homing endonuclease [Pectobacterium phage Ymer]|uniref:Homing endonuclease n=2 Tax=unclassified Caudoviricetes TaxID=2788787 RepID=A0AB39ABM7_9CAUD